MITVSKYRYHTRYVENNVSFKHAYAEIGKIWILNNFRHAPKTMAGILEG